MRRVVCHHPAGHWDLSRASSTLTLLWEDRHRRRVVLKNDQGEEFLLDLPHAVQMGEGDGLETDQGGWILVKAGDEDVAEVTCSSAESLARIAWHIGNRHKHVQILSNGSLRLPWDHVLVEMILGLGAMVVRGRAPFHPEGGAYAKGGHNHEEAHDHGHGHGHGHHHGSHGHDH